jgi:hypothetical protein
LIIIDHRCVAFRSSVNPIFGFFIVGISAVIIAKLSCIAWDLPCTPARTLSSKAFKRRHEHDEKLSCIAAIEGYNTIQGHGYKEDQKGK